MRDEWSGFADLMASLIEKYAADLDLDHLPDPKDTPKRQETEACQKKQPNYILQAENPHDIINVK